MVRQVRVTVLKRELYKDLVDKYAADKSLPLCPKFKDGQVFNLNAADIPSDFCSWAWADIQRDVVSVYRGANYPWINQENAIVSCCTDGLRPVVFMIEAIDV